MTVASRIDRSSARPRKSALWLNVVLFGCAAIAFAVMAVWTAIGSVRKLARRSA